MQIWDALSSPAGIRRAVASVLVPTVCKPLILSFTFVSMYIPILRCFKDPAVGWAAAPAAVPIGRPTVEGSAPDSPRVYEVRRTGGRGGRGRERWQAYPTDAPAPSLAVASPVEKWLTETEEARLSSFISGIMFAFQLGWMVVLAESYLCSSRFIGSFAGYIFLVACEFICELITAVTFARWVVHKGRLCPIGMLALLGFVHQRIFVGAVCPHCFDQYCDGATPAECPLLVATAANVAVFAAGEAVGRRLSVARSLPRVYLRVLGQSALDALNTLARRGSQAVAPDLTAVAVSELPSYVTECRASGDDAPHRISPASFYFGNRCRTSTMMNVTATTTSPRRPVCHLPSPPLQRRAHRPRHSTRRHGSIQPKWMRGYGLAQHPMAGRLITMQVMPLA